MRSGELMGGDRAAQTKWGENGRHLSSYSGSSHLNRKTVTVPLRTPLRGVGWFFFVLFLDLGVFLFVFYFTFYELFALKRMGT